MKKARMFLFVAMLLGTSLLVACGQAATPNTNLSAPTDSAPVSAPVIATENPIPSSTSSAPVKADACTLLSKDEVGKVFGQAVEDAAGKGLGGVCEYTAKNLSFSLTAIHSGGAKYMKDTRTKLADLALDVPGLGDGAFYNTNSISNILFVGKGDAVYLLYFHDSSQELSQDDRLAKEKALAEVLLSHLP